MEKLSPKWYGITTMLKDYFTENNIKFDLKNNNFEIKDEIDIDLFLSELADKLDELDFSKLKKTEISFFNKTVIVISIEDENKDEEYIKIFYNKWIQYYKKQLFKLLWLK